MREQKMGMQLPKQVLVAFAGSGISFFLLRVALHPHVSVFDPLDGLGDYFALGVTAVTFSVILYRVRRGASTGEQVDDLLVIDDESI